MRLPCCAPSVLQREPACCGRFLARAALLPHSHSRAASMITIFALVLPATVCTSDCASCFGLGEAGSCNGAVVFGLAEDITATGPSVNQWSATGICWSGPHSEIGECALVDGVCVLEDPCGDGINVQCHREDPDAEYPCGLTCPACTGTDCGTGANCWCRDEPGEYEYACVCDSQWGYTGDIGIDGPATCTDLDGCSHYGVVDCGTGATCVDIPAPNQDGGPGTGYTCVCDTGYEGDTFTDGPATCADIDGCDGVSCGIGATCVDATAPAIGYTCTCGTGYEGDTTDTPCVDVNSCDGDPCGTGATCGDATAPATGYICICGTGYEGDTTDTPCVDVDGCDGDPCGADATCVDATAPATGYTCHGNIDDSDSRQLLDECALHPCTISIADAPGTDPSSDANRFQCPVSLQCTDTDLTNTDSYVCTCPSCASVMLSDSTTSLLTAYFDSRPAVGRYVASGVASTLTDPSGLGTCRDPAKTGCMDETALNYDPNAAVPDNDACVARVYGCMDPRATNYDATANSYDPTGGLGEACKAGYCQTLAQCVAIANLDDPTGANAECATAAFVGNDLADHRRACEAKGAPGTTYYPSGIDVPTISVCRFEPAQKTLCPFTVGDVNDISATHDSGCTCSDSSAALMLENLQGGAGLDECASITYDGAQVGACMAPAHRLCAQGRGADGWEGRTCTDFREAFTCPDDTNGFVCRDPNPMWLDDFTCSCVYDDGRYADADSTESCVATDPAVDAAACAAADISGDATTSQQACTDAGACDYTPGIPVASICGTSTVFTSRAGLDDIDVSNYGLTLFLESHATTRNHICRQIHQPADSDCSRGTL